jgi:hypothetical protein
VILDKTVGALAPVGRRSVLWNAKAAAQGAREAQGERGKAEGGSLPRPTEKSWSAFVQHGAREAPDRFSIRNGALGAAKIRAFFSRSIVRRPNSDL